MGRQGVRPGLWAAALAVAAVAVPAMAADVTSRSGAYAPPAAVDTTLGRQVPARPDAPAVATTRHVRATYVLHCAGCHGLDGAGAPAAYVPSLRRMGDFLRVPGGRAYLVQVPGVMGSGLDDAQVADVANWLLGTLARESVPAGFEPYGAAEVAQARRAPPVDVAGERQRLQRAALERGLAID